MTWKEFKDYLESKGVKDDTKIDVIDTMGASKPDDMEVRFGPQGIRVY